jgi:hypothetical protein
LEGEEGPSVAHAANSDSAIDMKTMCADCLILTIRFPCAVIALRLG